MKTLLERIGKERLFFEGGMGTLLQQAGLHDGLLPDMWCLENPLAVETVHRSYLQAGCTLLKTNSFGANRLKLEMYGQKVNDVVGAAVRIAKQAVAKEQADAYVVLDIGPTGKLLKPIFGSAPGR